MKKFLSIILVVVLAFCGVATLAGCSKNNEAKFDVVFITDGATIDDNGYNESAWNGVKLFSDENGLACRYYQPKADDDKVAVEDIDSYISLSVDNGAKYIVMQGEKMANAVNELAPKYENVNFLLVGAKASELANVMTVSFDIEQAGFLAGYTAVLKDMTKLGYFGSVNEADSKSYGTGFVNGAGFAADEKGIPVYMDYANYDAENLDYDYSFTITPEYRKIEDSKEKTFKVTVENGIGSGVYTDGENVAIMANPAPAGKAFDHWDVKSDTEGVKDKKVNINTNKNTTINLLVGDCDCTLTAVWRDADTMPVTIYDGKDNMYAVLNAEKNSEITVTAPSAKSGMKFDHWEGTNVEDKIDIYASQTKLKVEEQPVDLVAVFTKSDAPTFDVTVQNGTGSGSYRSGDRIELIADAPEEGYMFYKWNNIDNQGLLTGISMDNEYCYNTSFEMVDRYSSILEAMYDEGAQVIFGGGNPQSISIFTASWKISHQVYAFGYGIDQGSLGNCLASVVTDYNAAAYNALKEYKGATNYIGTCANGCLYVTGMSINPTYTDSKGNEVEDKNYNEGYAKVYSALADGTMTFDGTVKQAACLTVNYWEK